MLNQQTQKNKKASRGFTLIELLVVIAIIALLISIVVPSLQLVRKKASAVVCMTNTKNMSLAWYSYQSDSNGRIMSSQMGAVDSATSVGWIGRPHRADGSGLTNNGTNSPPITDEDAIRGIQAGRLYEYLESTDVYKCPGDTIRTSVFDQVTPYVTYSMSRALHYLTDRSSNWYRHQITRFGEITSPSSRYVFVEVAQERNWNESGWFSFGAPEYYGRANGHDRVGGWGWWDPLAINHGDSSILGFADGHAETRRWQDTFTKERVEKFSKLGVTMYNVEFPPAGQTADIEYMARGWAYRYRP